MAFLNRLKYYLIGVGLGIMLVLAIFKDRKLTQWTPENQVFKVMTDYGLAFSDYSLCQLQCVEIDSIQILGIILEGDVEFGESDVKGPVKTYHIKLENPAIQRVFVDIKDTTAIMRNVQLTKADCNCK